jgi:ABC-2 type transport system permease protein
VRLPEGGLAAVAELRFRLLVRRLRSRGGTAEGVARVVLYAMAVPLALVFAGLVSAGSYRAARAGTGLQATVAVTSLFFGLWQAWTAVSLMVAEREGLDLKRFLAYPLPLGRIWVFGLVGAILGDPFALFWLVLLGGFVAGAAAARLGPWLLLLSLDVALFAIGTVALVALLQEVVTRALRLRWIRELGILLGLVGWLVLVSTSGLGGRAALAALARLQWIFWTPALAAAAGRSLFAGRALEALPYLAAQAVTALAAGWVAWRMALASARAGGELRPPRTGAAGKRGRSLWPAGLGPVFEQHLKYLVRHPIPRVSAVVLPALATFVVLKAVPRIPPDAGNVLQALPLFGLAALSFLMTQELWLNAFGLDRAGARALFLAPLDPAALLRAKNAASAACAMGLFLLGAVAYLWAGGWPPAWALAGVVVLELALAPLYLGLGNLVSVLNPRSSTFSYQRGRSMSPLSTLAGMAIFSAGTGLMAAPALLAVWLDEPWVLTAGWAGTGLLAWIAYRATLPRVGRLLQARREQVLASVCEDDL